MPRSPSSNLSRQASLDNDIERIGHGVTTERAVLCRFCVSTYRTVCLCVSVSTRHSTDCTP